MGLERMSRLRIAFDPWVLHPRFRHHGTNGYAARLINHVGKAAMQLSDVEFFTFACPGLGDPSRLQTGSYFSFMDSGLLRHDRAWRLGGASLAARRIGADLLFSPSCNLFPLGQPPLVCTIHDTTPVAMPSHSRKTVLLQRFFLHSAARRSCAIITVSERSKQDIVATCRVPGDKVKVVYNGYDREFFNAAPASSEQQRALRERLGIRRPYLFHHGVLQPRKNLKRLIEAHRMLLSRHRDIELDLVLAGPPGWDYMDIGAAAEKSGEERGRVVLVGEVSSHDLALLLKGTELAVIPSLYEGFCLPMVEAMACGVPTVASSSSCLPEISGNALLYFDPTSVEDIAATMESVLFHPEVCAGLISRGLERVREFSWERCARETLEVLLRAGGYRRHAGAIS
jgi:glycosyltransferase involved in cell wall biosynthesis